MTKVTPPPPKTATHFAHPPPFVHFVYLLYQVIDITNKIVDSPCYIPTGIENLRQRTHNSMTNAAHSY